jgi:ABC-type multidrug transport system fused ATPase/permease subunit
MALLVKLIRKRVMLVVISVCAGVSSIAVALWWNAQLSAIINMVSAGIAPPAAAVQVSIFTMLAMCAAGYLKSYLSGCACEYMAHELRMGYARHFAALPVMDAENLNAGEQLSKLQNEIAGVSAYLNANLFQLFDDGVRFFITFTWLLFISPALTLAANLPALLILAYVLWASKAIGAATLLSQQAKGRMNAFADTLLTLFPVIRLYDASRLAIDGYESAVKIWEGHTIKAERIRARLMSLSAVLSKMPLLFLILTGGHMAINSLISVGTLYIFLNLSENVSGVLMNMPGYIGAFRQFAANMKRLEGKVCL